MMRRSSAMGGGARVLRSVGRSVAGAGVKDKLSPAASKAAKSPLVVSVSSPPATTPPAWSSSSSTRGPLTCYVDGDDWEAIGDEEFGGSGFGFGFGFRERCLFGSAPSMEEAEKALCTIQQIFVPVTFSQVAEVEYPSSVDGDVVDKVISSTHVISRDCSSESESDWIEPALHLYNSRSTQYSGKEHILDAVHLFQTNPPFKRMVTALSSDPAVWDAVMKNEVVQELKKSFYEAQTSSEAHTPDEDPEIPTGILRWIMDSTKGKIMEFFGMISKLVNDIFHPHDEDKESKPFDNVVKSSFMLSVVVFIIVVMTRIQKG